MRGLFWQAYFRGSFRAAGPCLSSSLYWRGLSPHAPPNSICSDSGSKSSGSARRGLCWLGESSITSSFWFFIGKCSFLGVCYRLLLEEILGGAGRWLSWTNAGHAARCPGAHHSTRWPNFLANAHPFVKLPDCVPTVLQGSQPKFS